MAKRAKKQVEAWELEVKELKHQIREIKKCCEQQIEPLQKRITEIQEQHGVKPIWDASTPLLKFVNMTQIEQLNIMLNGWEPYLLEKIGTNIKKQCYFKFELSEAGNKRKILLLLKDAQKRLVPVFWMNKKPMSMRQLFLYFEQHSNLGSAEGMKSALRVRGAKSGVKVPEGI